jgi:hypothetical protein
MPPVEEAKTIFQRLGYTVSGEGTELRAERKWRTVYVTAVDGDAATSGLEVAADGGRPEERLRCFVTWKESTAELREYLSRRRPGYEWAIIGVEGSDDDPEYEVVRGEADPVPA